MDLLDKYGIKYNVLKTYPNGVRVGNVPNHKDKRKRTGAKQAWFPSSWDAGTIKRAAEHVSRLQRNRDCPDNRPMFGTFKGVRVGVIRNNGQISTAFPDIHQP